MREPESGHEPVARELAEEDLRGLLEGEQDPARTVVLKLVQQTLPAVSKLRRRRSAFASAVGPLNDVREPDPTAKAMSSSKPSVCGKTPPYGADQETLASPALVVVARLHASWGRVDAHAHRH